MNFRNLLFCQPENIKRSPRAIEYLEKKLANTRIATVFNQTCLNEYLLPTLTNIYISPYSHSKGDNLGRVLLSAFLYKKL